jgi:hypothetical protein
MKTTQMTYAGFLLIALMTSAASAAETKLMCQSDGGPDFTLKDDHTMTVSASGGWSSDAILQDSPITVTAGKVLNQEIIAFTGEAPQKTLKKKEVVRISEASGKYSFLLENKPYGTETEGNVRFIGYMLKGGRNFPGQDEQTRRLNNRVTCFGKPDGLEFK